MKKSYLAKEYGRAESGREEMPGAEGALSITSPEHQDSNTVHCSDVVWCGNCVLVAE